ncbi:DUF4870 domain-containing protein [Candidatus Pacearchaeota archaeon]|nr:DUF4870 domain-containing protein [Candidatus Pacearchaeota archaeon]
MAKKNVRKNEDRTLVILTHLIGIFAYVFGAALIFLLTKDLKVKKHAKNALNWQISLIIYYTLFLIASLISSLLMNTFPKVFIIFPFSLILSILTVLNIVFSIIAAAKANDGKYWKYPLSLNIIEKIDAKEINQAKRELKKTYKEVRKDLENEFKKK